MPTKKLDSKIKKNLCRGLRMALGKGGLCRGSQERPLAKNFVKKIKILCRGSDGRPSAKADGARLPLLSTLKLPRASLPRTFLCRGLFFAEGLSWRPSAKKVFAECPRFGPRQSLRPSTKNEFPVVYLLSLISS